MFQKNVVAGHLVPQCLPDFPSSLSLSLSLLYLHHGSRSIPFSLLLQQSSLEASGVLKQKPRAFNPPIGRPPKSEFSPPVAGPVRLRACALEFQAYTM